MKRCVCVLLVVLLLLPMMTACDLSSVYSEKRAQRQTEKRVKSMLTELSDGNTAAAKTMLFPDVAEDKATLLLELQEYIDGRKIFGIEQNSWKITTAGDGAYYREDADYWVKLDDGTEFYLLVRYMKIDQSQGLDLTIFLPRSSAA